MPGDEEDAIGLDQKPEGTGKPDRSASAPRHRVGVAGGDSTPCMSGLGKNNASGADRAGSVWAYDRDAGQKDHQRAEAIAEDSNLDGAPRQLGHGVDSVLSVPGTGVPVIGLIETKAVLPIGLGGDAKVDTRL